LTAKGCLRKQPQINDKGFDESQRTESGLQVCGIFLNFKCRKSKSVKHLNHSVTNESLKAKKALHLFCLNLINTKNKVK